NRKDPVELECRDRRECRQPSEGRTPSLLFLTSAGARFTMMYWWGKVNPLLRTAALMRLRDSRTAVSGNPTIRNSPLPPVEILTSTSTRYASMPYTAALRVLKSMVIGFLVGKTQKGKKV